MAKDKQTQHPDDADQPEAEGDDDGTATQARRSVVAIIIGVVAAALVMVALWQFGLAGSKSDGPPAQANAPESPAAKATTEPSFAVTSSAHDDIDEALCNALQAMREKRYDDAARLVADAEAEARTNAGRGGTDVADLLQEAHGSLKMEDLPHARECIQKASRYNVIFTARDDLVGMLACKLRVGFMNIQEQCLNARIALSGRRTKTAVAHMTAAKKLLAAVRLAAPEALQSDISRLDQLLKDAAAAAAAGDLPKARVAIADGALAARDLAAAVSEDEISASAAKKQAAAKESAAGPQHQPATGPAPSATMPP